MAAGWPGPDDAVGIWGRRPVSWRGRWVARQSGAGLVTVEDGFLRSVRPGDPALSLIVDPVGIHFDASAPSALEVLLETGDLSPLAARAEAGIAALKRHGLTKYSLPAEPLGDLPERLVLVVDQTCGDASVAGAGADGGTFRRMLAAARTEHPGAALVVKGHPETALGRKGGHLSPDDLRRGEIYLDRIVNPWDMLARTTAVYSVSSQLGYEALLAGCPVRCFGHAFYSGWGLTADEAACDRRTARRTVAELFAAAHLLYPVYYDPWRDRLCSFEEAVGILSHLSGAARPEPGISAEVFARVRLWKRRAVGRFRPPLPRCPQFASTVAEAEALAARQPGTRVWVWGSALRDGEAAGAGNGVCQIEDGFLRSIGLGAALTEPLSLVFDRRGIYFDPSAPSDLEALIAGPPPDDAELARAGALRAAIVAAGLSKYNTGSRSALPDAGGRRRVLVPGQVEDDASIRRGAGRVATNLELLRLVRAEMPEAFVIYKPHPDVEAGLRPGRVADGDLDTLADWVARDLSAAAALEAVDEVWTMTSLMGFEALLRGVPVTCLGAPFYAGWGLTRDLGDVPARRQARPQLDHLVWAALIAYPRYVDPVTGLSCPPEVIVERLAAGVGGAQLGLLAKLQGALAGHSWIWRRG